MLDNWPFGYDRNWVVCGGLDDDQVPPLPPFLFDRHSRETNYDAHWEWWLSYGQWAVFGYFTSYDTSYMVLVTQAEQDDAFCVAR